MSQHLRPANILNFKNTCKTDISPLKNGAWKTILSFWVPAYFTKVLVWRRVDINSAHQPALTSPQLRQGVIQYSQFSPWNGDESFPPH